MTKEEKKKFKELENKVTRLEQRLDSYQPVIIQPFYPQYPQFPQFPQYPTITYTC